MRSIELMEADPARLVHRNAFNVTAMSFTPERLAAEIRRHLPDFEIDYEVDPVRQAIADSWPDADRRLAPPGTSGAGSPVTTCRR